MPTRPHTLRFSNSSATCSRMILREGAMTGTEKLNFVQAINLAINDAMAADPKVLALGEEVGDKQEGGVMGVTKGLSTRFGDDRVKSTPISEQAIIGAAGGAAVGGYRPMAEIMMMNFVTVAMDMITNQIGRAHV